jgi:hypothetical protein
MSAGIEWSGLKELKKALTDLPDDLAEEAQGIAAEHAEAAYTAIKAGYASKLKPPPDSGNLERGLARHVGRRAGIVRAVVINTAPHAGIYESGSQTRKHADSNTPNPMPPGNVFVPVAIRERTKMYRRLVEMVRKHGFTVTGDVG